MRPCPTCGRVISIKRWPGLGDGAIRHRPLQVLTFVEMVRGHQVEVVLVPAGIGGIRRFRCWGSAGRNTERKRRTRHVIRSSTFPKGPGRRC